MSPPLKGPLEQHLEPAVDDAQVQKIAQGLKAGRRPAPRRVWVVAVATAVVVAVIVGLLMLRRPPVSGPLQLADDGELPAVLDDGMTWAFADGSRIALEKGAALQVVANQPAQFTLLLQRGKSRFEVTAGGPRKWLIEAGLVTVEVVGTVFTVDRAGDGVCVSVEYGTVIVRGDLLPDRLVRLDAGQSTCARPESPKPVKPTAQPAVGLGIAQKASAETLLRVAETAREAGQYENAAMALFALLRTWPEDPNVPSAAFTLGRLELENLGRPLEASRHFALAAKSPPLTGDARLRQVEALVAAGDTNAAETVARAAIQAAPQSPHAGRLQRWLSDPQHAASWLH